MVSNVSTEIHAVPVNIQTTASVLLAILIVFVTELINQPNAEIMEILFSLKFAKITQFKNASRDTSFNGSSRFALPAQNYQTSLLFVTAL